MKTNEYTSAWPTLDRACEVSIVSGCAVNIIYDTIEYPEMPDDFELIKNYFSGVIFAKSGELSVTIHRPPKDVIFNGEKWMDEKKRAESVAVKDLPISHASEAFLKTIIERFGVSISKRETMLKIANVLACMDSNTEIGACHIAESFHYAGMNRGVTECSVFSSMEKSKTADMLDLLDKEQIKKVNGYIRKLHKK